MNILIVHNSKIPALKYGGIERVVWNLGYELVKLGHNVTFLVKAGSFCSFADVVFFDEEKSLHVQIPKHIDFVHLNYQPNETINFPHLITIHGNLPKETVFFDNTNFVSSNHAKRYGADAYIYNGINWDDYGKPDLNGKKSYVHFLGKAAWRLKNVKGAIKIAHKNKTEIKILGGTRLNVKMGPRFTLSKWARFYGMVGGEQKSELLRHSKALVFPVLWHEPFGLALIESLYFGCPVLATTYGSLPEIITKDFGILSNNQYNLVEGFKTLDSFNRKMCHEYAADLFNSKIMAKNYLKLYETILNGGKINKNTPRYIEAENGIKED